MSAVHTASTDRPSDVLSEHMVRRCQYCICEKCETYS